MTEESRIEDPQVPDGNQQVQDSGLGNPPVLAMFPDWVTYVLRLETPEPCVQNPAIWE